MKTRNASSGLSRPSRSFSNSLSELMYTPSRTSKASSGCSGARNANSNTSRDTGPPKKNLSSDCASRFTSVKTRERASPVGRFTITPIEPRRPYWVSSTTAWPKFGSASCGLATRNNDPEGSAAKAAEPMAKARAAKARALRIMRAVYSPADEKRPASPPRPGPREALVRPAARLRPSRPEDPRLRARSGRGGQGECRPAVPGLFPGRAGIRFPAPGHEFRLDQARAAGLPRAAARPARHGPLVFGHRSVAALDRRRARASRVPAPLPFRQHRARRRGDPPAAGRGSPVEHPRPELWRLLRAALPVGFARGAEGGAHHGRHPIAHRIGRRRLPRDLPPPGRKEPRLLRALPRRRRARDQDRAPFAGARRAHAGWRTPHRATLPDARAAVRHERRLRGDPLPRRRRVHRARGRRRARDQLEFPLPPRPAAGFRHQSDLRAAPGGLLRAPIRHALVDRAPDSRISRVRSGAP